MTFGTGWAVAGTCPVPALVMATGGTFLALFVIAGFTLCAWMRAALMGAIFQRLSDTLKRRMGLARHT